MNTNSKYHQRSLRPIAVVLLVSIIICVLPIWSDPIQPIRNRTKLISFRADGQMGGNDDSGKGPNSGSVEKNRPIAISNNGRYVAFLSEATNLDPVPMDNTGTLDVFLRDRKTEETICVSQIDGETFGKITIDAVNGTVDIAEDEQNIYVAFSASGYWPIIDKFSLEFKHWNEIFVAVVPKSQPLVLHKICVPTNDMPELYGGCSGNFRDNYQRPSLSSDGTRIAFECSGVDDKCGGCNRKRYDKGREENVCGNNFLVYVIKDADYVNDIYPWYFVSVYATSDYASYEGAAWDAGDPCPYCCAPGISGDGKYVAFLGYPGEPYPENWEVSDGRMFSQQNDPDNVWNDFHNMAVIIRDIDHLESVDEDHYFVASLCNNTDFSLLGSNDPLPDSNCGATETGSYTGQAVPDFDISNDGQILVFSTASTNMVPNEPDVNGVYDIYVRDIAEGQTKCVSYKYTNESKAYDRLSSSISGDGRYVTFVTMDQFIVPPGETYWDYDVFLHDQYLSKTIRVSLPDPIMEDPEPSGWSKYGVISNNNKVIAFTSNADNLVPEDGNVTLDVFVRVLRLMPTQVDPIEPGPLGNDGNESRPSFSVYPNPFVSFTRVLGHEKDDFAVYDVSGRQLGIYKGNQIGVNLPAGIYFVECPDENITPCRIVKVK